MIRNNHIVCDLSKVIYAKHYYENQHGQTRRLLPGNETSFGEILKANQFHRHIEGDKSTYAETEVEAAKRLGIIDVWQPVTRIQFANSHAIEYTGAKAQSIWQAWNERIFSKQKKR